LAEYWQEHCKSLKEENEKLLGEYQCPCFIQIIKTAVHPGGHLRDLAIWKWG